MTEPLWRPGTRRRQEANITRFMQLLRPERDPTIRNYASFLPVLDQIPQGLLAGCLGIWRDYWGGRKIYHRAPGICPAHDEFPTPA